MTLKVLLQVLIDKVLKEGDVGPLAKCSFEDTTDQLIKAGIFWRKR